MLAIQPAFGTRFGSTWFDGVLNRASATPVAVADDATSPGSTSRWWQSGLHCRGPSPTVSARPGGVQVLVFVQGVPFGLAAQTVTGADGTYQILAYLPGPTSVRFQPAAGSGFTHVWYDGAPTRATATPSHRRPRQRHRHRRTTPAGPLTRCRRRSWRRSRGRRTLLVTAGSHSGAGRQGRFEDAHRARCANRTGGPRPQGP